MKGDVAVQDCHEMLSSYTNSSACVAPKNAGCIEIEAGAWGCVFEQRGAETPAPTSANMDVPTPAPTRAKIDVPTPAPTRAKIDVPTPAPTRAEIDVPTPGPTRAKIDVPYACSERGLRSTFLRLLLPGQIWTSLRLLPTRIKVDVPTPAPTEGQEIDVLRLLRRGLRSTSLRLLQLGWGIVDVPTPVPTRDQNGRPTPARTEQTEQPTPAPTSGVRGGYATYCTEGPIRSGYGDWPAGYNVPHEGDIAVQDCHEMLSSYTALSACVRPRMLVYRQIGTGAWGCVFEQEGLRPV
uniref:Uncharacterized protein n=1 Tax=Peronospora matthiolae TaxID=2874970 RepID=A0AAV1VHC3_9STRA